MDTLILRSRPHPEQGFRSCIGILRLAKQYDAERLDAACAFAGPGHTLLQFGGGNSDAIFAPQGVVIASDFTAETARWAARFFLTLRPSACTKAHIVR